MNLDNYLLAGFNVMANTTITISGFSSIPCIFDGNAMNHEKNRLYVEDFDAPIIVKTSDLPANHKSVIGKLATLSLDSKVYRIDRLRVGGATTYLYLNSKNKD